MRLHQWAGAFFLTLLLLSAAGCCCVFGDSTDEPRQDTELLDQ